MEDVWDISDIHRVSYATTLSGYSYYYPKHNYFLLYLGGRRSPKSGAPPFSPIGPQFLENGRGSRSVPPPMTLVFVELTVTDLHFSVISYRFRMPETLLLPTSRRRFNSQAIRFEVMLYNIISGVFYQCHRGTIIISRNHYNQTDTRSIRGDSS